MSTKRITPYTCQKEFSNTFDVLNNTLVYFFCGHSVSWKHKISVSSHVNSKTHIKNKKNHEVASRNMHSQILEEVLSVAEGPRTILIQLTFEFA